MSSLLIPVAGTIVFTASTQDGEGLGLLNNYARGDASFLPSNHAPLRSARLSVVEVLSAAFGGDFLGYIEDHPEEFGVLVGVLADYPGLEELLRELRGVRP